MLPRDLFGVALRVLGVWFVYLALDYAFFAIIKTQGAPTSSTLPATEDKLFAAFYVFLSLVLLVLADHIVLWAYGPTGAKKTAAAE